MIIKPGVEQDDKDKRTSSFRRGGPFPLPFRSRCLNSFISIVLLFSMSGCATWYQRTLAYQDAVRAGRFEEADKVLNKDRKQARGKNRVLYLLNKGYVQFMLGDHKSSNSYFEIAEQLVEEQGINLLTEAAILLSNPEIRPFTPEDFEVIMINFYKALNYLSLNDMEGALVEVRKINIKLNILNDKYPDHKNRYQRDAFAHLLMGLIYDAANDANNAFIAYRNAYNVYQSDYIKNFGIRAPEQLKKDLLRTAYRNGFTSELKEYEKEFNVKYSPETDSPNGQVILFWLNGFGPVKSEWSINFFKRERGDGVLVFYNDELGLSFPFFIGHESNNNSLADFKSLRVAFPKYIERPPHFLKGSIVVRGRSYQLEMAENINEIAFKTLNDRMIREMSNSLLRLAVKKGTESVARNKNEWIGFAVGVVNSITEKADTRNWQTLPYSISYARIPLQQGNNTIDMIFTTKNHTLLKQQIEVESSPWKTQFRLFHTMQ